MSIRLLTKSEIVKAKSKDRQTEINEGLKLAKKVDNLRELASSEETNLNKFRKETLANIQEEILTKSKERDELVTRVTDLEKRKEDALRPLTDELAELEKEKKSLADGKKELEELSVTLDKLAIDLVGSAKEIIDQETRIKDMTERTETKLSNADTLEKDIIEKHGLATRTLENAEREASVTIANAKQREEWVTQREKATFKKEEELRNKEIDLAKDFIRLKDREATLERNLKRK